MSTRAQQQPKQIPTMNLKKEMWGIAILGVSGLLGGGLLSLQLGDGRLMGPFGQLLSLGLYALLGMGSYLVIAALFSIAWGIFTSRFNLKDIRLWVGYGGATITGTILMFLLFPSYRLQGLSAGGKTGEFIGSMCISLFSKAGTFLITTTAMVLFLVLATQTSPAKGVITIATVARQLLLLAWNGLSSLGKAIVSLFAWESAEHGVSAVQDEAAVPEEEAPAANASDKKHTPDTENATSALAGADATEPQEPPSSAMASRNETNTAEKVGNSKPARARTRTAPMPLQSSAGDHSPESREADSSSAVEPKPKGSIAAQCSAAAPAPATTDTPKGVKAPLITNMEEIDENDLASLKEFKDEKGEFVLPDPEVLHFEKKQDTGMSRDTMIKLSARMVSALNDYKISGEVTEIHPGPVVTMYEFVPEAGIRVSKIESLNKDLALSLAATRVRIVAPIPGKSAVGIEVPNKKRQTVFIKEGIADKKFQDSKSKLTMVLGKDIKGKEVSCDLAKAPHLLVAGATGSGKSVGVNAMIMSILFRATPRDVRFIMIDPKMVELSIYNDIPHLLLPVVTDPQKANLALQWAVKEMERRYQLLSDLKVRNLADYNKRIEELEECGIEEKPEHLPAIVVVIDEFADLMMVAAKDVEIAVARIAQKARAVGIHLILATQRPSTDVITGLIKSNFPTRIAFMVSSRIDSKVVLDKHGAETLLGNGDMLYSNRGLEPVRVHGSFVSTSEIQEVVEHLKSQGTPDYDLSIVEPSPEEMAEMEDEPLDSKWDLALDIVSRDRIASISYIQRKLKIGYNRAARMVERMQFEGIVSPPNGTNQREVLISAPPD